MAEPLSGRLTSETSATNATLERRDKGEVALFGMSEHGFRRGGRLKKEATSENGDNGDPDDYAAIAKAALSKGERRSNVAGFLAKAYQIFDNPAWSHICGWGDGGETVVIRKQIEFAQRILPLFFNHSNLQSFVRQLNMYNFRKVVQDPNSGEFKHDLFRQGNEHLLHKIKRKQSAGATNGPTTSNTNTLPHRSPTAKVKLEGGTSGPILVAGGIVQEADQVLDEMMRLRKWKEDMEKTVAELKRDKQTLQSENQMLKRHVAEQGNQQKMLQKKMQKILYCMYDGYVSGLRGITGPGDADGMGDSIGDPSILQGRRLVLSGSDNVAAGTALEKALQELAALAGENISSKISALDMDNPWTMAAAGGGSPAYAPADAGAAAAGVGDADNENGLSVGASGGRVIGGGSLKRNRTWSTTSSTSYEWLRSLRDPDPLGAWDKQDRLSFSPAKEDSTSANGSAEGTVTPTGFSATAGDGAATGAGEVAVGLSVLNSSKSNGMNSGGCRSSSSNGRNSCGFITPSNVDDAPSLTPDRDKSKRQRRLSLPKTQGGGSAAAAAPSDDGGLDVAATDETGGAFDSTNDDIGIGIGNTCTGTNTRGSQDPNFNKTASFQPDAPLPRGSSLFCIVKDSEEAETTRQGVAAAGGSAEEDEIWGGGALVKTLSEGATQLVNELGEMGHRQGEASTKIDSLGYHLASLLDPNLGFDEMMFGGDDDVNDAEDLDDEATAVIGHQDGMRES